MSSTTERVTDALNTKKNVGESPVKRSYAKLRHPMRAVASGSAAEKAQDESTDSPDGKHVATEEYTTSSTHAALKEMTTYLSEDEGQDALKRIFMGLGQVGYDGVMQLLLSDELSLQLGKASLMAGREVVSGSSDGLQSKLSTLSEKLPKFVTYSILPVIAVSGGLLMLGLLLALWRFAIFGL